MPQIGLSFEASNTIVSIEVDIRDNWFEIKDMDGDVYDCPGVICFDLDSLGSLIETLQEVKRIVQVEK